MVDTIAILDFGGQYCHLISRRIRDMGVFSKVFPCETTKEELLKINDLKGIILSGGAASVYDALSPKLGINVLSINIPILGICYGHQLVAHLEKGMAMPGENAEYGVTKLTIEKKSNLLSGLNNIEDVWMNHGDIVTKLPDDYEILASTKDSPIAVFENNKKHLYGVQFHPEVTHTLNGIKIIENFVLKICNANKQWQVSNVIDRIKGEIRNEIGDKKAIIGLSGGIDSSAVAILVSEVIKEKLVAVYVDTGLMRYQETEFIQEEFSKYNLNLKIIKAEQKFFNALKGVTDPEEKRKIIGKLFIDIFEEIAQEEKAEILIQGTIYSDRIESGATKNSSVIKSHHNVGGLPENIEIKIYEPFRDLYKDEVRSIAKDLGLSREITERQVFPGPGFAVRIIGEVTREKADIVRKASHIVEEELKNSGLWSKVWMSFAVLLSIKSVGIQGDSRSYKYPIAVRIIESKDAMTANFSKIPYEILEKISSRITNEIKEVNRVVYDISNKPPATMEWE